MNIKVRKKSHFLDMIDDVNYAEFCLDVGSSFNYNPEELLILKDKLLIEKKDFEKIKKRKEIFHFLKNAKINEKYNILLEKKSKLINLYYERLERFESELAYIIIKNIKHYEQVITWGFSEDYIDDLVKRYKHLLDNSFYDYYYDEKNDDIYMIDDNGERVVLSEIPEVVRQYIDDQLTDKEPSKIL